MAFEFEARDGKVVDPVTGLSICMPRMQPDGAVATTEYQYPIYLGDRRIHGLAVRGTDAVNMRERQRSWTSCLDLGMAGALEGLRELKRMLGDTEDDIVFVQGIARGLLQVLATNPDLDHEIHYRAVVSVEALASHGIAAPDGLGRISDGRIALAEVRVPARSKQHGMP